MTHYKDIFFDLDRTLWDFEKNSEAALQIIYDTNNLHQYAPSFEEFMATYRKINKSFWEAYGKGEIDKIELRNGRFLKTMQAFEIGGSSLSAGRACRQAGRRGIICFKGIQAYLHGEFRIIFA